jgi:hypothetical protein
MPKMVLPSVRNPYAIVPGKKESKTKKFLKLYFCHFALESLNVTHQPGRIRVLSRHKRRVMVLGMKITRVALSIANVYVSIKAEKLTSW